MSVKFSCQDPWHTSAGIRNLFSGKLSFYWTFFPCCNIHTQEASIFFLSETCNEHLDRWSGQTRVSNEDLLGHVLCGPKSSASTIATPNFLTGCPLFFGNAAAVMDSGPLGRGLDSSWCRCVAILGQPVDTPPQGNTKPAPHPSCCLK